MVDHPSPAVRGPRTASPQARLGRTGEWLAGEHYERLGYRILERNYRTAGGELDLVAFDGRTLVFIEVKTRSAGGFQPIASISAAKQRRMRATAAAWLRERTKRPHARMLRFDAVGIVINDSGRLLELERVELEF